MSDLRSPGGILAGHPEAAAIVIAVKGLGRYPELRGGKDAEKFIVGTLASYLVGRTHRA